MKKCPLPIAVLSSLLAVAGLPGIAAHPVKMLSHHHLDPAGHGMTFAAFAFFRFRPEEGDLMDSAD